VGMSVRASSATGVFRVYPEAGGPLVKSESAHGRLQKPPLPILLSHRAHYLVRFNAILSAAVAAGRALIWLGALGEMRFSRDFFGRACESLQATHKRTAASVVFSIKNLQGLLAADAATSAYPWAGFHSLSRLWHTP